MRTGLLALLFLAACTTADPEQPANPTEPPSASIHLAGTKWRRVDDLDANPHGATIEFMADRASGHTGCNRWFASVTQNGEELRFGQIGMTRMACGAEVQAATERNFLAALNATRYGHYDQAALVLLDESQQVIARLDSED